MMDRPWLMTAPLLVLLAACADPVDPLNEFFGLSEIHRIEIELDAASYEALQAEPRVYASADVRIDGTLCEDVGLRLKGAAGSFVPLGGDRPWSGDGNGKPGKSAFIIDFNRFVRGRNYLGLKKLTLNNMVQDPSSIHEFLGYALFREGGVPASRVGWADVALNGDPKYLYALIETPDNDVFLDRWFATEEGDLFEGEYGVDFYQHSLAEFDHDHGLDVQRIHLRRVVEALDAVPEDADPVEVLERHFDLDEYLTFAVTEIFLGHWDGYVQSANNYLVYHHPGDDRWRFLPWGIDQVFADHMGRFGGVMHERGPSWEGIGGRVHQLCFRSPACLARLHDAFQALFERIHAMDLIGLAERARALTAAPTLAESERYGDPGWTIESQERVFGFIPEHQHMMEPWLACLAGHEVDQDGDGYDDCTVDCQPEDPRIHPGAPEVCNFRDDDCDCRVDDREECPPCMPIEDFEPGYTVCFTEMTWEEARAACADDLASFPHPEIGFELAGRFSEGACDPGFWIGLNDREQEGVFVWSDGSETGELPFYPEHGDEAEELDCVAVTRHGWQVRPCGERRPYLCNPR